MDEQEFRRLADGERFIPGIYNYCDRWCERCAFTARCRNYATMNQQSLEEENVAIEMEDFLAEVEQEIEGTTGEEDEMIEELNAAAEEVSSEELQEFMAKRERANRQAKEHPLAKDSFAYYELVSAWRAAMKGALRERNIDLASEASWAKPRTETEEGRILDALQVVLWYQHFIHVKLMRALMSREDERDENPAMKEFPKDYDGSAKIALIAMDKSIAAWADLQKYFPSGGTEAASMIQLLQQLREATEERFPHARLFVRPGFDQEQ